ncbi:TonB-dependent receptor plug domain-containing protein [Constantimarinum furrinae]|uniref:TonB-dependent Receptor n=1 Tax=Constantimarinum furrinae TaxID=2562285 RepID=A0A7G8PXT1_9FLAO|nr:TonB-dependent receptor [Constantimarinum furrinae]QNJ99147.1 TonB-dependent Receptor [Constantimarinum furrinae]
MSLNKNNILFYFSVLLVLKGYTQEDQFLIKDSTQIETISEIIVTATRTKRQLSSLPLPAQIISKKELENSNSIRLSDILNEQTGLITIPDFGGGEGIQLQGMDAQYSLILVDGVPLIGRSAGTLDLNRITVGNIKQIEIVKGASSGLYGSEALGGVINIITETPKYGLTGSLDNRYGSFNTSDLSTGINFRKSKLSISGFFNRYSSDGYKLFEESELNTVEPFHNYTFQTKLNYELNESTTLFLSGRYFTQDQDYNAEGGLTGASETNEWNTHLRSSHTFGEKWKSYFEFYATGYTAEEFLNNSDGLLFQEANYDQLLIRPEIRVLFNPLKNSEITGGIGYTHESLDRNDFSTKPEFNSPYIFAQYDLTAFENLNIILGARFDMHNQYESQFSPKLAARFKLNNKIAVKGSVGYGFKAPDFRQLYFNFTNGTVGYTVLGYNAAPEALTQLKDQGEIANLIVPLSEFLGDLSPESSVSINLGIDYDIFSSLSVHLNIFRNNIDNLIDTRIVANKTNGQNVFSYFNVNRVFTQGAEMNISWQPHNHLKISGGYQLLYAKDKDVITIFENGEAFAREDPSSTSFQLENENYFGLYNRSRHMANVKIFHKFSRWGIDNSLRATYRSRYALSDSNGNGFLDTYDTFAKGYVVIDVALNKTIYKNYRLGVGVDNMLGFTDPQNSSNIPGRIYYGKLNIQF